MKVEPGERAPDFSLPGDGGTKVALKDFRGQNLVLYFYPKDDTPGCTIEAKDFTALSGDFKKAKTAVLGISKDSPERHDKFCQKYGLKIRLGSDAEGKVLDAYGVWKEKKPLRAHFHGHPALDGFDRQKRRCPGRVAQGQRERTRSGGFGGSQETLGGFLVMDSIGSAATRVLGTGDARGKAGESIIAATEWRAGQLSPDCRTPPPARPARPAKPELLPPGKMPKRRKGGTPATRFALLHAIAHIEFNAIDLAWDIIARFGDGRPRTFLDDWAAVGAEEARHFTLLADRLEALGGAYGDLPAHGGLWDAAEKTGDDVLARLAIAPLVLEARGLDVTPGMIKNFKAQGDPVSAAILEIIYRDEVGHVEKGVKWFHQVCAERGLAPKEAFQAMVRQRFPSGLKPPFNTTARNKAGLPFDYYGHLTKVDAHFWPLFSILWLS